MLPGSELCKFSTLELGWIFSVVMCCGSFSAIAGVFIGFGYGHISSRFTPSLFMLSYKALVSCLCEFVAFEFGCIFSVVVLWGSFSFFLCVFVGFDSGYISSMCMSSLFMLSSPTVVSCW